MAEYIELDALLKEIEGVTGTGSMVSGLLRRLVKRVPTADVYTEEDVRAAYTDGYSTGMVQGMEKATVLELRKTVELLHNEYEKAKRQEFVYDPLAYAVYQVWKAVDGRRKNGR